MKRILGIAAGLMLAAFGGPHAAAGLLPISVTVTPEGDRLKILIPALRSARRRILDAWLAVRPRARAAARSDVKSATSTSSSSSKRLRSLIPAVISGSLAQTAKYCP